MDHDSVESALEIRPYQFEPSMPSRNTETLSESDLSESDNEDIIPDENTHRIGNTSW